MKKVYLVLLAFTFLTSCYTTSTTANQDEEVNVNLDLTAYLRKIPGLAVSGTGANANFKVRGSSSISLSSQPLFVLNDAVIPDYGTLYKMVNMNDLESAKLLKDPSETSLYGSRGANGVIVVKTKN